MKSRIDFIDKTTLVNFSEKKLLCKYDGLVLELVVICLSTDSFDSDSFEGLILYSTLRQSDSLKTMVFKRAGFELFKDEITLKND